MTLKILLILVGVIALQGGLGFAYYKYQKSKMEAMELRVQTAEANVTEITEKHEDFKADLERNQEAFDRLAQENSQVRREMNDLKRKFRQLDLDGAGRTDPASVEKAVNENFTNTFNQVGTQTQ